MIYGDYPFMNKNVSELFSEISTFHTPDQHFRKTIKEEPTIFSPILEQIFTHKEHRPTVNALCQNCSSQPIDLNNDTESEGDQLGVIRETNG